MQFLTVLAYLHTTDTLTHTQINVSESIQAFRKVKK